MNRNPVTLIDEISSFPRKDRYAEYAKYEHLYDLADHLEKMDNLEIEDIILQACNKDGEIQFGRKVAQINLRALMQIAQDKISNKKASVILDPKILYLEAASIASQVAALSFGPGFTAVGLAFDKSASYSHQVLRSREDGLNHIYQCERMGIDTHTQQVNQAEKEVDRNANMIDRMIQNSRRQGELIAG